MIYLASPYSHENEKIREERYWTVCYAAARLMAEGHHIFSPIAMTHGICASTGGDNFAFLHWKELDEEMIRLCDEFWILRMDGWEESKGIKAELAYAVSLGKPWKYV